MLVDRYLELQVSSFIFSDGQDVLMNPSFGLAASGSAISALIPQTIVVSPILINADPSAVVTEPDHELR